MENIKNDRKPRVCRLCGENAGRHPGRHMKRHHNGLQFKQLENGDNEPMKLDPLKLKGGESKNQAHGFQKGNDYFKNRLLGKRLMSNTKN